MTPDPGRLAALAEVLTGEVRRHGLPGAAFGVATSAGPVLQAQLPGVAELPDDALFFLASLTKGLCATLVLQLVGEGLVDLSEPVPGVRSAPGGPAITAWHLLTHTSGLPEVDLPTALAAHPRTAVGLAAALRAHPAFPAGTRHAYSSLTFFLLAELVRRAGGADYDDQLRDRVLVPAGAEGITLDPRGERARMVPLQGVSAGLPLGAEQATDILISQRMPGAGLWGTVHDVLAFGTALLRDARDGAARILPAPLVALMAADHTSGLTRLVDGREERVSWGLGWQRGLLDGRRTLPGSDQVLMHDGAAGGVLWIDPPADLAVVFLTSALGAPGTPWRRAVAGSYGALRA